MSYKENNELVYLDRKLCPIYTKFNWKISSKYYAPILN